MNRIEDLGIRIITLIFPLLLPVYMLWASIIIIGEGIGYAVSKIYSRIFVDICTTMPNIRVYFKMCYNVFLTGK